MHLKVRLTKNIYNFNTVLIAFSCQIINGDKIPENES